MPVTAQTLKGFSSAAAQMHPDAALASSADPVAARMLEALNGARSERSRWLGERHMNHTEV